MLMFPKHVEGVNWAYRSSPVLCGTLFHDYLGEVVPELVSSQGRLILYKLQSSMSL